MVRVQGPMFSLGASGSLAKTVTFSTWKGRPYVRELVTPANPKSGLQVGMRSMFAFLAQEWTFLTVGEQASWSDLAEQIVASPFNGYMKRNQKFWRDFSTPSKDEARGEVGTLGATPTTSAVAGVRSVTVTAGVATANDNWGVIVYRDLTTAFTPALSNVIKVGRVRTGATTFVFVDSPLVADEYFYNYMLFSDDGVIGTALGEDSATVT